MKKRKNVNERKTVNKRDNEPTATRGISPSCASTLQAKDNSDGFRGVLHSPHPRTSTNGTLFPSYSIYFVLLLTLFSRVNIVINPRSWWILHPDEIYQSLEVAHTELYGYGFRPYEFLEPPQRSILLTSSEKQYESLGMYSMRSWLHARLYLLIFSVGDLLSLTTGRFVLAKVTHAVICGFLPLAIFQFLRVLKPSISHDVPILAAILVAFSDNMIILGTHTLINSLLSPLLFLILSLFLYYCCHVPFTSGITGMQKEENRSPLSGKEKSTQDKECIDQRRRFSTCHSLLYPNYYLTLLGGASGLVIYMRPDSFLIMLVTKAVFSSKIKLIPLIHYVVGAAMGTILGGLDDYISYKIWFISPFQWLCFQFKYAGVLFGRQDLLFYVREVCLHSFTMIALTVLIVIMLFLYTLNKWCYFSRRSFLRQWYEDNIDILHLISQLFGVFTTLLVFYSFQQHKEVRFIHDTIVIFLCCAACSVYCLHQLIQRLLAITENSNLSNGLRFFLYTELCLYAVQNYGSYPSSLSSESPKSQASYRSHLESGRVNICLDFISHQPDVTGLVIDYSVYLTGGYTILHKDIPIFAKTHFEFREWKRNDRQIVLSKPYFGHARNVSVALVDRVSNFITVENSRLLLKTVANSSEYNYVVVSDGRKFPKKGFKEVFSLGSVSVYKRLKTKRAVEYLKTVAEDISIGDNSTLLQYEASWLLTLGLLTHAKERLERALQINNKCVRCWQLLYVTLQRLDPQKARLIPPKCYQMVGKEKCGKPTEKVVLHPEYNLGLNLNFPSIST